MGMFDGLADEVCRECRKKKGVGRTACNPETGCLLNEGEGERLSKYAESVGRAEGMKIIY